MKRLIAALFLTLLASLHAHGATTLLPNGRQCFADVNGALSSGQVFMYFPGGTSTKPTWQDSGQVTLNTNPINLDANGCAVIYGVGTYRQIVTDANGDQVWDQLTTDTSAFNSVFWASLSGGTPNVITISYPGFNGTNGSVINFVALNTNTGAATLNPSSFGNVPIVKDTTGGPVALVGGEITAGNVVSVVYYTTDSRFHILNPAAVSASGSTSPLCGFSGLVITNNSGTPNTLVDISASQGVMQDSGGLVVNSSNISAQLNTTLGNVTSTAGGMDGEAVGTSQWIYIFGINNGSGTSVLGSTSATAPNLPSGYNYKCRMGAMRVDGSGNLVKTVQKGAKAQYTVLCSPLPGCATTNTQPPNIINGINGSTFSATTPVLVAASITGVVPSTAVRITVTAQSNYHAGSGGNVLGAPSTQWGGTNRGPAGSASSGWFLYANTSGGSQSVTAELVIEGTSLGFATDGAGGALDCMGWTDSVNAN